ncbi:MAG: ATP-dependent DNA helicase RecG [Fulvivirga sp.]|uniref:ATP-dependent DNA helicase RecG n=1 Tax=Fulvivirga sp. TaxID=1931237 RepID=UPI0032EE94B2
MPNYFDTKIEFLKGVGPQKAALLNKELNIFTYGDLIQYYPFRHEDRTKFYDIKEVNGSMPYIQVKGKVRHYELKGPPRKQRLIVYINDGTGELELVWFKGAQWMLKKIQPGVEYVVFGKPTVFGSKLNVAHPEIEVATMANTSGGYLQPVYSSTDLLRRKYLDSKAISKLIKTLLGEAIQKVRETLPNELLDQYALIAKPQAIANIHFPENINLLQKAQFRLKFEELFYVQVRLLKLKLTRIDKFRGISFDNAGLLNKFYNNHLPFDLTNAQKRVIKEIYKDMRSGKQMNRLLQGDVGSGKTIVAFICLLIAIGSDTQGAIMAPTEILATQHYTGLKEFSEKMGLRIALLTGSTKKSKRKIIHEYLKSGELHILVGTHALLEEVVQFKKLGLAIVDEQHRFGVAQRSKLWQKNSDVYPHVLVMTATPIPRTLAMTLYGDLDISVIDELPAGRKPIKTVHRYDSNRLKVNSFLKEQIDIGRQVYVVYPLIEESEKLDLKDLMDGYESIARAFPETPLSIVHGKMKPDAKEWEMQRFVKGETKIMVATTVIEVGVNVPNASVMVIENAERFGLAQLHQLRGRVGRGADQSYCILISGYKLSKEAKTRIETMVRTNNGFEIADTDLQLRGPGDLMGTQQSGILDLLIADLGKDGQILQAARQAAQAVLNEDPDLTDSKNAVIKMQIASMKKTAVNWSRIS